MSQNFADPSGGTRAIAVVVIAISAVLIETRRDAVFAEESDVTRSVTILSFITRITVTRAVNVMTLSLHTLAVHRAVEPVFSRWTFRVAIATHPACRTGARPRHAPVTPPSRDDKKRSGTCIRNRNWRRTFRWDIDFRRKCPYNRAYTCTSRPRDCKWRFDTDMFRNSFAHTFH